jgi:hypothetical protein
MPPHDLDRKAEIPSFIIAKTNYESRDPSLHLKVGIQVYIWKSGSKFTFGTRDPNIHLDNRQNIEMPERMLIGPGSNDGRSSVEVSSL